MVHKMHPVITDFDGILDLRAEGSLESTFSLIDVNILVILRFSLIAEWE